MNQNLKPQLVITFFLSFISLTFFNWKNCISQDTISESATQSFHLYYSFSGLGSAIGSFQPKIKIDGTNFLYTYEQNSYYGQKNTRIDTVCVKTFRQSSIDSIIDIVKDLKDTSIRVYNFCIMSGGIHCLTVTNGIDTTNFQLGNTFHYSALKIANILNEYAPSDKQLWANEQMIKDAEDCMKSLLKSADNDKNGKSKKKKNGT